MSDALSASYALCSRAARKAASNFHFTFWMLPAARRRAMCALYAFLRHTDDLGDGQEPLEVRRIALLKWRESLQRAMRGEFDSPLLPALADTVARYQIPLVFLGDVIDGVEMDLDGRRYETFAELEQYCHRVASAVGLACIHIWGFRGSEAYEPARQCGVAFQLTNILRDLKEDAEAGRVYLPAEDLRRFDYSAEELLRQVCDERFAALVRFEIERAEVFFLAAEPLAAWLDADGRRIFRAMLGAYRELLEGIKRSGADLLHRRVRLSPRQKLRIAARAMWRTEEREPQRHRGTEKEE